MDVLTTRSTLSRAAESVGGWRDLAASGGEPYCAPLPGGSALTALWHLSDLHLCDCESPARLEYLDRYSDPDSVYRQRLGDIGTYRPQEAFTVQVAVSMLTAVNSVERGPASAAPIQAVLLTGDLTDNAQRNELLWYRQLVQGGTVSPRSGAADTSGWVGATDEYGWDERYWHPDGPPTGRDADRPTRIFGYPGVPGLVAAARRDIASPGLGLPWISVYGNHDGLLQGTVAPNEDLRALARGAARITGLPSWATPMLTAEATAAVGPARYIHDETSPRRTVHPDGGRDFVTAADFAKLTGTGDAGTAYFTAEAGEVTVVCLDTVNPHGGWQGSLDAEQFGWLRERLGQARRARRRVVIASHHPSFTLVNGYTPEGAAPRVLGPQVVECLLDSGVVIAWLAGHVHRHDARRHGDSHRGFWEITTASLIDWPQQARIVEIILDAAAHEIALVSTVADHAAPPGWRSGAVDDPVTIASISRALAANDYRLRQSTLPGLSLESTPAERNTVWRSPDPIGSRCLHP